MTKTRRPTPAPRSDRVVLRSAANDLLALDTRALHAAAGVLCELRKTVKTRAARGDACVPPLTSKKRRLIVRIIHSLEPKSKGRAVKR